MHASASARVRAAGLESLRKIVKQAIDPADDREAETFEDGS
jgi:hypothetical protein